MTTVSIIDSTQGNKFHSINKLIFLQSTQSKEMVVPGIYGIYIMGFALWEMVHMVSHAFLIHF